MSELDVLRQLIDTDIGTGLIENHGTDAAPYYELVARPITCPRFENVLRRPCTGREKRDGGLLPRLPKIPAPTPQARVSTGT
jgi:hypothetical protein